MEILKGIWGNNFNQNVQSLTKYIEGQYQHLAGNPEQYKEEVQKNLIDIFSNHMVAQNFVNSFNQSQGQPQVQGAPMAQGNFGQQPFSLERT